MLETARHYLCLNTPEGLIHRHENNDQFHSGGRVGESAFSTANSFYIDNVTEYPTTIWNQMKNARQDLCNYMNHFVHWELDWIDSLGL